MDTVTYEAIRCAVDGGVATITLDRPERRNAYNWKMGRELQHAFTTLDADDAVRAIVVTGNPEGKAFCAGADLGSGEETFSDRGFAGREPSGDGLEAPRTPPWELKTPIIAAINGHAVGVGITLPLQWDVRYVAEDAKIGFVFNRRGIVPEANSQWLLPRLVGLSRGLELLLSGRIFSGAEAAGIGIASAALPRDEVLPAAQELAQDIAANTAPVSVAITKKLVYRLLGEDDRLGAQDLESELFRWTGNQADAKEGVMSFLEKREPDWKLSKTQDFPEEIFSKEI